MSEILKPWWDKANFEYNVLDVNDYIVTRVQTYKIGPPDEIYIHYERKDRITEKEINSTERVKIWRRYPATNYHYKNSKKEKDTKKLPLDLVERLKVLPDHIKKQITELNPAS